MGDWVNKFDCQSRFAQEAPEHSVFILNSLLFLMAGFLVMFMACGFCMLEAGLVRSKNTTMQLTKNISLFSIAAVGYYILGYNLMYPLGTWSMDGVFSGVIGVAVMEAVGITADKADDISYATTGSDYFFPAYVLRCYSVNRVWGFSRAH